MAKPDENIEAEIRAMVQERNTALASLNETTIRAYAAKYGARLPSDQQTFWAAVHKAITAIPDLPADLRQRSIAWLKARGMSHRADSP
jgi:hypothetical protein